MKGVKKIGKNYFRRIMTIALIIVMLMTTITGVYGATIVNPATSVETALSETGKYIVNTVTEPTIGSIGGEWAIIGLARSGYDVPEGYYEKYYQNVVKTLKETNGILHARKYTEYSRVILALTAMGRDVTNIAGYNLLEKLADFDAVKWQGINGPIWALIALDSHDYKIPAVPAVKTQTTRDLLISEILSKEVTADGGIRGGFTLSGTEPDADVTAMALISLAKYRDRSDVKPVVSRALSVLSDIQLEDGSFTSMNDINTESTAQVICALSTLGIDSKTDSRYVKNGNWTVAALLKLYAPGGGFKHTLNNADTKNQMSTEQGYYALTAYDRFLNGQNTLYDMTDVKITSAASQTGGQDGVKVKLNGEYIAFDQAPIIENGRTLVPMRAIFEALGMEVSWDGPTKAVTGILKSQNGDNDKVINLTIGNSMARVNSEEKTLDVPAKIVNGRTLVPVRFISESLDAKVTWDNETKTVIIEK